MIKDSLNNAKIYYSLSKNMEVGLKWLEETDLVNLVDGRYEIDGKRVYASVQTYAPKEDAKYEAHRRYVDIQYMISGVENVGITSLKNCTTCKEYDGESDLEFFDINSEEEYLELSEGNFIILYPHDAHKPSIVKGDCNKVKKIVVKVKV